MTARTRLSLAALCFTVTAALPAGAATLDLKPLAEDLVGEVGSDRGLCVVVGEGAPQFAEHLANATDLLVEVHLWDRQAAEAARRILGGVGLYGTRIVVDHGAPGFLPYADNLVDALFCVSASSSLVEQVPCREVLRVLRPGGTAVVGDSDLEAVPQGDAGKPLERWVREAPAASVSTVEHEAGAWTKLVKPSPAGADEWSHWQHGPDNNPVSEDSVIKPPYMTQFLATPWFTAVPSVSVMAGGRLFRASGHLATHEREQRYLNTLYASNAYNGLPLWTRSLPDGFLTHRSLSVATEDSLILAEGDRCLLLEAATGEQRDEIPVPTGLGADLQWKWLALEDGVLYGLLGTQDYDPRSMAQNRRRGATSWTELAQGSGKQGQAWGTGGAVIALELATKRTVWRHAAEAPIDSRSLCMKAGRLFFHSEGHHVACLDAKSGDLLWKNTDPDLLKQISNPFGAGSGFQVTPYTVCTKDALYFGGQGRRQVVALSAQDGKLLWTVSDAFNATNLVIHRGLVTGHTPSCTMLDALTGRVVHDPGLHKLSCARLTASPGTLFHRGSYPEDKTGEGTVAFDLSGKTPAITHAFRPACNDGLIPAGGLLHVTQWDCDTTMQLVGALALCPAGEEGGQPAAKQAAPLELVAETPADVAGFDVSELDWPTYRGDNQRSSSTRAAVPDAATKQWEWSPTRPVAITAPVAAGGLVFTAGTGCDVRALDAATGKERWQHLAAAPISSAPSLWEGRLYFGCADGFVYALEAATGRLLWRFRAAPRERKIMVYGALRSTWPVNSGVLVHDGIAYAAAGIISHDGTHVYALDALTGKLKWHNGTSGRLSEELRSGVSAQGDLTLVGDMLWLAGGNVVSPAGYDLRTGECVNPPPRQGTPAGNTGREVCGFLGRHVMVGGPRLFTQEDEWLHKWQAPYEIFSADSRLDKSPARLKGRTPPAFGNGTLAIPGRAALVCLDTESNDDWVGNPQPAARRVRWKSDAVQDCVALAVAGNAVVAAGVVGGKQGVSALDLPSGNVVWTVALDSAPLPGGLCLDREGHVIVATQEGSLVCFGG